MSLKRRAVIARALNVAILARLGVLTPADVDALEREIGDGPIDQGLFRAVNGFLRDYDEVARDPRALADLGEQLLDAVTAELERAPTVPPRTTIDQLVRHE